MPDQERYSRQIRFGPIGTAGQSRLRGGRALLVGVGALGTWLADTLVRAGIGQLTIVDRDVVDASNLQRQHLFTEADVEAPKAIAAKRHLVAINSTVELDAIADDFSPQTFASLARKPDLILDGTDNFATRYLLNDLAMRHDVPFVYGGVVGSRGTAMVVLPGETPCLRCVMPEPPAGGEVDTCETAGVIAPAVSAVTAFQSAEALKILTGRIDAVTRGILVLDVWDHEHALRMQAALPAAHCATCRGESFPALEQDWAQAVSLCGRNAVQVQPRGTADIDLAHLAERLDGVASAIDHDEHLLRFEVEQCRFSVFAGGRALLFGTADTLRARTLYDRYVGA